MADIVGFGGFPKLWTRIVSHNNVARGVFFFVDLKG